ncbi:unnamed protein product [Symbiodinium sp. KB8]|nr:unnamed protein product [Symbiodinium sp. KB8]
MGAVPSVPDVPVEDLKECAKSVFEVFVCVQRRLPIYTKQFGVALLAQMRQEEELRTNETDWPWLRVPPTPTEPLGTMTAEKLVCELQPAARAVQGDPRARRDSLLGAVRENWKKRTFVFMNEADQFEACSPPPPSPPFSRADYDSPEVDVTDEKAPKPKGAMKLRGYRVHTVKSDVAKEQYGSEFALNVKPYWSSDRRRIWSLRFEDEESMKKAEGQLREAISNAPMPLNPDPVMRAAFKAAYQQTRWSLGVWGWFSYYKTEEDMLANMIVDKAEDEIMPPVYAKIPSGGAETIVRRQVVKLLDGTIGTATAALWKGACEGIKSAKPKIEAAAKENVGPVIKLQMQMRAKISEAISSIVTPVIADITKPIFGPLVDAMGHPLAKAYAAAIKAVSERVLEVAADADATTKLDNAGPGRAGQLMAGLIELVVALNPAMTLWHLEWRLEREIRDLAIRMVFSYTSLVAEGKAAGTETMDLVAAMAVHDATNGGATVLNNILFETVAPKMDQELRPLIAGPVAPIKDLIVPPLDMLVDLDDMLNNVLYDMINGIVDGIVAPAVDGEAFACLREMSKPGVQVPAALIAQAREVFIAMNMDRDIPSPAEAAKLAEEHAGEAPAIAAAAAAGGGGGAAAPAPAAAAAGAGSEKVEATAPAPGVEKEETQTAPETAAAPAEAAPAPAPEAPKTPAEEDTPETSEE